MAPRRRSIKKGETRMDAALDAMEPFGFSRNLIQSTVHTLLKVYGGSTEGWVFIEDSGYALLIDTLLEKQANSSPRDNMIEANPGDGPDEAMDTASAASESDYELSSNGVYTVSAATSELGTELPSKGVETVSATSELGSLLPLKSVDISSVTSDLGS
ncbi:uncharacterized protein LOC109794678 isoform X3 [Cajanus cajan]|uniref:uncharacterized protein LOC109794678 isoform X3 n=1 Tax=Cajanus cajan TaxID=3821 RepID=UPI00098D830B|nr:uncharacterized protein LOC109794678 isoform X3 [Cajanus cajan]